MHEHGVERREFQRLRLDRPISGTYDNTPVTLAEIGILGARIEHETPLAGTYGDLRFAHGDREVDMRSEVIRTSGEEGRYVSGLRFLSAVGESGDHLRTMLAELVSRVIEQKYDNSATRLKILRTIDGDKTIRGVDAHFHSYRYEDGSWRRRRVFLPEQPATGFTVARGEDADEMHRLCAVYEASDEEGRRLIRMFAELSVSDALQIPPRASS
ncbi:MAG TPA: PilZ domain-containing protein [Thermoanaerobaculia bacterium]|nr:PilZ domain-containing protein [Thermoanaerobaculia bacterium]